jgi:hypothetical protein
MTDDVDVDPLLAELGRMRQERDACERRMRQLVAYGREFVGPRPYPLAALAAGLANHSSARGFYGADAISEVAALTGAKQRRQPPHRPPATTRHEASPRGAGRRNGVSHG